ncbi:hypothetical protein HGP16_23000 [Rhizobium sp. P40RR-XXII]|uniref:DUF6960 family protein n=1 Tax=unclassified Rhizobium TaxID=2613769 RepID=UPI001456B65A|nr:MULTISPECIES: hypothetical protein [unclassified Rhizobium]NLR85809.1 hypothetical protein [Rhizobium sp. P28RR-XV]NLS19411.1 hypothetical protein [Rhizobium sp. P40RR-XXII]
MDNNVIWALCPWFEENGEWLIDPDDLERIRAFRPYGVVFRVFDEDREYVTICSGDQVFRVRRDILKMIEPKECWRFEVEESAFIKESGYSGTVASIRWHQKENKPMYLLKVGGTIKSRRYWPEELEKI